MVRLISFWVLLLILSSCISENNNGYPKKVYFDSNGGTQIFRGEASFGNIKIYEGDDTYRSYEDKENGSMKVSNNWLCVEYIMGEKFIKITAKPNNTGRKRKVTLDGFFGQEFAIIDVIQKPDK